MPHDAAQDVSACIGAGAERGRVYGLLRPLTGPAEARPQGRHTPHPAGRVQTIREEFKSLYYEVYKLWRLLGSPPGEPELIEEVVASLEDHQGQERGGMPLR